MDTSSKAMHEAEAKIVRGLRECGVKVRGHILQHRQYDDKWRLVIACAELLDLGPRKLYSQVQRVIGEMPGEERCIGLYQVLLIKDVEKLPTGDDYELPGKAFWDRIIRECRGYV